MTSPLAALQATLAGEHAAVYVFGVLAARVSDSREPSLARGLRSTYATHRGRRDQLIAMVRAAHAKPVAADLSYELPTPSRTAAQLAHAALVTERRCAEVYAAMVGNTSQVDRQWAIDALAETAVRQLAFGGRPDTFPGVPGL